MRQAIRAIANAMPKLCGAGVFAFAGYPAKTVKGMEGFFGLIAEYDSNAGFKVTGLYESSHGDPEADPFNPKTHEIGGVGGGTTATGRPLLFLPFNPFGGYVLFNSGLGIYGGTPYFGGGPYVNVGTANSCP